MSDRFAVVEKRKGWTLALFGTRERAELYLRETLPKYVQRGYLDDKALRASDFTVIERYVNNGRPEEL